MNKETIQVPIEYELTDLIDLDEDDHGKPDEENREYMDKNKEESAGKIILLFLMKIILYSVGLLVILTTTWVVCIECCDFSILKSSYFWAFYRALHITVGCCWAITSKYK